MTPAVVNISAENRRRAPQPFFEFSPFFDEFFGGLEHPPMQRQKSVGSGFIINRDGLIVTNDHVVNGAEKIEVKLSNDNVYPARIVGSDPKTDIAVIKISPREELPLAVLGDSDTLQVGQWAIAIGNPFGLDRTFTVGVISATGRSGMGIETYEDFIQTDASINPGNSGGPLLNINGEVIGINTAIVAAGQGIGFAIPINMAKGVVSQLVSKGNVSRSWLGVSIQPVTEELARSFGLKKVRGALIADVMVNSPAEAAGLRQGDVIVSFAGTEIKDSRHFQRLVAESPTGKPLEALVMRDGRETRLSVVLVSTDSPQALNAVPRQHDSAWLGLDVADLPVRMKQRGLAGVLVVGLDPEGLAADAGIQKGDILVSINRTPLPDVAAYQRALQAAERAGNLTILVRRGSASIYFALRPGGRR
jgi:Do/DeqQ family serine protease